MFHEQYVINTEHCTLPEKIWNAWTVHGWKVKLYGLKKKQKRKKTRGSKTQTWIQIDTKYSWKNSCRHKSKQILNVDEKIVTKLQFTVVEEHLT